MMTRIGKFEVRERIGRGGMGTVYKGWDPNLRRSVAIKQISSELEITDEIRGRFEDEAIKCAALLHKNVVTIFETGEQDGLLYIVMEFLEGVELKDLILARKPIPIEQKVDILIELCDGLHFAHQREIVHRDIKPGNVFVLDAGGVKIIDFGIAKMAGASTATRTGVVMGTPRYMAPEQVNGLADARSDQYSLGLIAYELLCYSPPVVGDDLGQVIDQILHQNPKPLSVIDPTIPEELSAIVERALRKKPAERYPDLNRMRVDLLSIRRRMEHSVEFLRDRVRRQVERWRDLCRELAALGAIDDEEIPDLNDLSVAAALQEVEAHATARITELSGRLEQLRTIQPQLAEARAALERGDFTLAVDAFEAIAGECPFLAPAHAGLDEARAGQESSRRQRLTSEALVRARTLLGEAKYDESLRVLAQAEAIPCPAESFSDLESLKDAVVAAQEAATAARREAEFERVRLSAILLRIEANGALQYAERAWNEAQALLRAAESAFDAQRYDEARKSFEAACRVCERIEEDVLSALVRQRSDAVNLREKLAQLRIRTREAGATRYATDVWQMAEARNSSANALLAGNDPGPSIMEFEAAADLYEKALDQTAAAREAEERDAHARLDAMERAKETAASAGAEKHAPQAWERATRKAAQALAELEQNAHSSAAKSASIASSLFGEAETEARRKQDQLRLQKQVEEERLRQLEKEAETKRRKEEESERWRRREKEAELQRERRQEEKDRRQREDEAGRQHREQEEDRAHEQAQSRKIDTVADAATGSLSAPAARPSQSRWQSPALLAAASALIVLVTALVLFRPSPGPEPGNPAQPREPMNPGVAPEIPEAVPGFDETKALAAEARTTTLAARDAAVTAGAEKFASTELAAARDRLDEATAAEARSDYSSSVRLYFLAASDFRTAEIRASAERVRLTTEADAARTEAENSRARAKKAGAERYAGKDFEKAERAAADAQTALHSGDHASATAKFNDARNAYQKAGDTAEAQKAIEEARRGPVPAPLGAPAVPDPKTDELRRRADSARQAALTALHGADEANAATFAKSSFEAARRIHADADSAWARGRYEEAIRLSEKATTLFEATTKESTEAGRLAEAERERQKADRASADIAMKSMFSARDSADSNHPAYQSGRTDEARGLDDLKQGNFNSAETSFRKAEEQFRRARPTTPRPPAPKVAPTPIF